MVVVCKVQLCPYRSSHNFCKKRVLGITNQGFCNQIYDKRGQVKMNWQQKNDFEMQKMNFQEKV